MMVTKTTLGALLVALTAAFQADSPRSGPNDAPQEITGTWAGRFSTDDARRPPRLQLTRDRRRGSWTSSVELDPAQVRDILASTSGAGAVTFRIAREAGTLDFEGTVRGDGGSGIYTFREDPGFRDRMARAGFRGLDDDDVFAAAVHDVGTDGARRLGEMGFRDVDFDDLMSAAIFDVDEGLLQEAQAAGFGRPDLEDLVAMRIHGVTRDFLEGMSEEGFHFEDLDDAMAFRIHGITREYLRELRQDGFTDLDADEVLRIRIHGLDRILRKRRGGSD